MRSRYFVDGASVVAVALFLGWVLSLATTQVKNSVDRAVQVCVPPGGTGKVTVSTPAVSAVYRDPTKSALSGHVDGPAERRSARSRSPTSAARSIALADVR